jgi:hypothetical protein
MDIGTSNQPLTGGCQCGSVRYAVHGAPLEIFICHCTECRKQSASAFGISVIVRSSDARLVRGTLGKWTRPTDSGRTLDCFFCPTCGSRVWHGDKETSPTISIKGGSLDAPPDVTRAVHIWVSRRLPGIVIPAHARTYPGEPP